MCEVYLWGELIELVNKTVLLPYEWSEPVVAGFKNLKLQAFSGTFAGIACSDAFLSVVVSLSNC